MIKIVVNSAQARTARTEIKKGGMTFAIYYVALYGIFIRTYWFYACFQYKKNPHIFEVNELSSGIQMSKIHHSDLKQAVLLFYFRKCATKTTQVLTDLQLFHARIMYTSHCRQRKLIFIVSNCISRKEVPKN